MVRFSIYAVFYSVIPVWYLFLAHMIRKPHSVLRIRIRFILPGPDPALFSSVLGSESVSYSNEHNKINWKGKFNNLGLLLGSWQTD